MIIMFLILLYLIVGTIELTPEELLDGHYHAMPEYVHEEERGDTFIMEITAYTSCVYECWGDPYITATGDSTGIGVIAGDPFVFPFGTRFIIPGYNNGKPCIMLDSGSKIKGYKLDLWMKTKAEARAWGRRKVKVKRI
jgi:3D (Asp-Asp-Asp) domain-containing protein